MKKILLSLVMLLASIHLAFAQDFYVNGIHYNVTSSADKTVEVTKSPDKYEGDIVIPSTVVNNSIIYNVTSIGVDAFEYNDSVRSITLPSSVTKLDDYAFYKCRYLSHVVMSPNVTSIGELVFEDCWSLSNFTIPASVTSIGDRAFRGCFFTPEKFKNNSTVTDENFWGIQFAETELPNGLLLNGNAIVRCRPYVTEVNIPSTITEILQGAFNHCNLTSIDIPLGVTTIGNDAFNHSKSLTNVTIPASVTTIGMGAFNDCDAITSVTNLATVPQTIDTWTFKTYGTLHVLPGCKAAYEAANYWKNFTIVEDATSTIVNVNAKTNTVGTKYTLDGRIINDEPASGTTYIMNGIKYIK